MSQAFAERGLFCYSEVSKVTPESKITQNTVVSGMGYMSVSPLFIVVPSRSGDFQQLKKNKTLLGMLGKQLLRHPSSIEHILLYLANTAVLTQEYHTRTCQLISEHIIFCCAPVQIYKIHNNVHYWYVMFLSSPYSSCC